MTSGARLVEADLLGASLGGARFSTEISKEKGR